MVFAFIGNSVSQEVDQKHFELDLYVEFVPTVSPPEVVQSNLALVGDNLQSFNEIQTTGKFMVVHFSLFDEDILRCLTRSWTRKCSSVRLNSLRPAQRKS